MAPFCLEVIMVLLVYMLACCILPNIIWQVKKIRGEYTCSVSPVSHIVWTYIYMIYVALALYVAQIGSVWDMMSYKHFMGSINTTPFAPGGLVPDILNIIMFMPLGFLLPLIWKNFRKGWKVALTGFGFSVMIEFCQLFNTRVSDVDDLIMNTVGACVGYIIWKVFSRLVRKTKTVEVTKAEPITYLALAVLGVCLLYNWRFFEMT